MGTNRRNGCCNPVAAGNCAPWEGYSTSADSADVGAPSLCVSSGADDVGVVHAAAGNVASPEFPDVHDLAELAVSRRGEIVAQVSAAADLSDGQRRRLTEVLTRIYHNPVSVQLNVDPSLLGGLAVAVGDEVIDGTLSSRLEAAATKLPD